jgi:hypothetical protein
VTPNPANAIIGSTVQFTASIAGTGAFSSGVTWALAAPAGSNLSPGTLTVSGLYTTPYPAPASVTVTATSTQDATKSNTVTVTLSALATTAGPALTVDAGNQTHLISPLIYGMNFYTGSSDAAAAAAISLPVDRWGGNEATSYNYLYDSQGRGADWYFENYVNNSNPPNTPSGAPATNTFNTQVTLLPYRSSDGCRRITRHAASRWRSTARSRGLTHIGRTVATEYLLTVTR